VNSECLIERTSTDSYNISILFNLRPVFCYTYLRAIYYCFLS